MLRNLYLDSSPSKNSGANMVNNTLFSLFHHIHILSSIRTNLLDLDVDLFLTLKN